MSEPISTQTIYEGSSLCRCGVILDPIQVIYGGECPDCRDARVRALISNKMVGEP